MSIEGARPVTAYLLYSDGLWIVTSASSPKNLPTSPLLVTWGTHQYIAGSWRELTPHKISSASSTDAVTWQFDMEIPLPLFLRSIVRFQTDQLPGAVESSGDGSGDDDSLGRQCADWYPRCAGNTMQLNSPLVPGSEAYLQINRSGRLKLARTSFSWSFWVKRTAAPVGESQYVMLQENATSGAQLRIGFTDGNNFTFSFGALILETEIPNDSLDLD